MLLAVKQYLDTHASPLLFYVLIAFAIGFVVWLSRKLLPAPWKWLSERDSALAVVIQMAPATILGALVGADVGDYHSVFLGTLTGLTTVIGHHLLQFAPGPYQGEIGEGLLKMLKKILGLGIVLPVLICLGCTGLPKWPDAARCVPDVGVGDLYALVLPILLGTGDVESALLQLAKDHGKEAVVCVVDQIRHEIATGASVAGADGVNDSERAKERAEQFLRTAGTVIQRD